MALFIAYSNVYNGQIPDSYKALHPEEEKGFQALSILLLILSGYFILHELLQFARIGKDYFTKSLLWNIIDVMPTVMIIAVVIVKMRSRWQSFEPSSFI